MEFLARGRRRRAEDNSDASAVSDAADPAAEAEVAPDLAARIADSQLVPWELAVEWWTSTGSAHRGRGVVAVLIDHLADLEEEHGPSVANALLLDIERILLTVVRDDDLLIRLDREGHLIVASDVLAERDLQRLAGRLHAAVGRDRVRGIDTVDGPQAEWRITVSIGIASAFDRRPDIQTLTGRALGAARSSGRHGGGHSVSAPDGDQRTRSAWEKVQELHRAFEEDELAVVFQPLIQLNTGRIEAVESLVRWQHPERGLLYPVTFLADLTRAGLDDRLTDFMFDRAAAESAELGERWGRTVPVSVNVDRTRRTPGQLIKSLSEATTRHGLPLEAVVVELSEQRLTATDEGPSADGWPALPLSVLVAAGVSVGVDGGSGDAESIGAFAPIRSLRWYKLHHRWLEPHRSGGLASAAQIARKQLGPTVPLAALGIGDDQRRAVATEAGIDWGQGWSLHKAVPASELYVDEVSLVR